MRINMLQRPTWERGEGGNKGDPIGTRSPGGRPTVRRDPLPTRQAGPSGRRPARRSRSGAEGTVMHSEDDALHAEPGIAAPGFVVESDRLSMAFAVASRAHSGHSRGGHGRPYLEHPIQVAELLPATRLPASDVRRGILQGASGLRSHEPVTWPRFRRGGRGVGLALTEESSDRGLGDGASWRVRERVAASGTQVRGDLCGRQARQPARLAARLCRSRRACGRVLQGPDARRQSPRLARRSRDGRARRAAG